MGTFLLVSGDFVKTGGMDRANYALASYLADRGDVVELVAHRVASDLLARPNVVFHRVPKPLRSYLMGGPLLDRAGRGPRPGGSPRAAAGWSSTAATAASATSTGSTTSTPPMPPTRAVGR